MTTIDNETLLFLPGASGNLQFWTPVANELTHPGTRRFVGWPGFGGVPADAAIHSTNDLVTRVANEIDGPTHVLAQSMGGSIALRVALQKPQHVERLVLSATSGGIDVGALGGSDWRAGFRNAFPNAPTWFEDDRVNLTDRLHEIETPTLLVWGDNDPISPVTVGQRLAELLPHAELVVIEGGTHDVVLERSAEVAALIERFLSS